MNVPVATRTVVEYGHVGKSKSKWIPPLDRIQMIGGDAFVSLSYSGDRGFAKYVGGDMKASNPLVGFSWLEEALKLRNDAVNKEFDKLATEKLPGHVSGSALTLKQRMALASELPETVGLLSLIHI